MEAEVGKVTIAAEMSEAETCGEFLTEIEQMERDLKDLEALYGELVKWKVMVEGRFEEFEKENRELVEESLKLRETIDELKNRVEVEKARISEIEKLKVTVEESFVKLKKENEDLVKKNLRLEKEAGVWREMNEELKRREEAGRVRILELECQHEVDEGLRMKAEVNLETLENCFKELSSRISILDKHSNMLVNDAVLDSCGTGGMGRTTGFMEAATCFRRTDFGIPDGTVVDLTEEGDDVHPSNMQTENLMEDSARLNPRANLRKSSPCTPHTKDEDDGVHSSTMQTGNLMIDSNCLNAVANPNESNPQPHTPCPNSKDNTESRKPNADPAAVINTTGTNVARHEPGSLFHIPNDSDDDTSDSPLRFKRKRVRSMNKENFQEREASDDKHSSQQLPVHERKRTPGTANSVFNMCCSSFEKVQGNIFHSSEAEWRKSILNKLELTGTRLFSSSSSDE